MSNNYVIDRKFNRYAEELEEFELADNNVMAVKVYPQGEKPTGDINYIVSLEMTADAMLGFGTELVRMALHDKEKNIIEGHVHLRPMTKYEVCQDLGVFLTPDSSEIMICNAEKDTVTDLVRKMEEEQK